MVVPSPGLEVMPIAPLRRSARSRMPSRPYPSVLVVGSKPSPSSRMVTRTVVLLLDDFYRRAFRATVLSGVGECLLNDPVDRRFELGGESLCVSPLLVCEIDIDVDVKAGTRGAVGQ